MRHFIIFTLVLNLLAGTAIFLYAMSAWRKYRQVFFKILLAYILSFNSLNIVDFCYQYARTNVFINDPSLVVEHPVLFSFLLFLVYCAELAITLSLVILVERLKGRSISRAGSWLLAAWALLFLTATGWGMLVLFRDSEWQYFYWIHAGWVLSMNLIILVELATGLTFSAGKGYDLNSIRSFSGVFLAGYGLFAFFNLDFYFLQTGFMKYLDPVMLLLVNICPLLWLRFFYEKAHLPGLKEEGEEEKLSGFCREYGISNREREVIEQVMMGRSNKEIEDQLFISFNTVKNHLYNVFQKTGVTSRSELIRRITHFGN